MRTTYDSAELRDIAEHYNESLSRFNSCFDFVCGAVDKPMMIDVIEAMLKHSQEVAKAEQEFERLGVKPNDIPLVAFKVFEHNNVKAQ